MNDEITNSSQVRFPWSLQCFQCDAGDGMLSVEHAIAEGWNGIVEDDGASWNYLGQCPDCAECERCIDLIVGRGGHLLAGRIYPEGLERTDPEVQLAVATLVKHGYETDSGTLLVPVEIQVTERFEQKYGS